MLRASVLVVAAAALIGDGFVHGLWTSRWVTSQELQAACERLTNPEHPAVPLQLGDWQGQEMEIGSVQFKHAGFVAAFQRSYHNQRTGKEVLVLLACGPATRLSVHTPDAC